jgi:hypothetical protein
MIWDSHDDDYDYLLGCDAMKCGNYLPTVTEESPVDGGSMFLWNASEYLPYHKATCPEDTNIILQQNFEKGEE